MFRHAKWIDVCAERAEKFGLAAAVVLTSVLIGGTRWRPVEYEPGKLQAAVTDVREQIRSSDWPNDVRNRFHLADYRTRVERLLAGLPKQPYDYTVPMFWPLHPPREPVREPVWHPVAEMRADAVRLVLEGEPLPIEEQADIEKQLDDLPPEAPQPQPIPRRALPFRCVSVRGVVEYKRQWKEIVAARRGQSARSGPALLEYVDFEIERQQAGVHRDLWQDRPWTRLEIDSANEILLQASELLADEAHAPVTSKVMTMPLPKLLLGSWDASASHPRIEQLRQRAGGETLPSANADQLNGMRQSLGGGFKGIRRAGPRRRADDQLQSVQDAREAPLPAGELLLFRFVDFTVQPGHAYRYRVRLKLPNPNFGLSHVTDPSVAAGIERWTPWSSPTNTAVVERDANFFLVDVEQSRSSSQPTGLVELFQWDVEFGAVNRTAADLTPGQPIAGKFESERFNPAVPEFRSEQYSFDTGDVFVDGLAPPQLSPQQHSALDVFPSDSRRAQRIGLPALMLVADRTGSLSVRDSRTDRPRWVAAAEFVEQQREPFRKQVEQQPEFEGLEGLEGLEDLYPR